MRNRGFSDKLYFINFFFAWGYTLLCVFLSCIGGKIGIEDYSFVSVVCPLVWAELGVHTAFILRKAWLENLNKHGLVDKENIGGIS